MINIYNIYTFRILLDTNLSDLHSAGSGAGVSAIIIAFAVVVPLLVIFIIVGIIIYLKKVHPHIFSKSSNTDTETRQHENEGTPQVKGSEPMHEEIDPEKMDIRSNAHDQVASKEKAVIYENQAFSGNKTVPESTYDRIDPQDIDMSSSTYEQVNVK